MPAKSRSFAVTIVTQLDGLDFIGYGIFAKTPSEN